MNKGTALTLGFGVIFAGVLLLTSGIRNRSLSEILAGETAQAETVGGASSPGAPSSAVPGVGGVSESQVGGGAAAPSPQSVGASALTGSSVGKMALDFFSKKYGPTAAAGIVGNLEQESSLNPAESGGYLAQWGGSRLAGLQNFARKFHAPITSASTQLAYIDYELRTSERATLSALLKAKSPAEAARIFSQKYERPGNPQLQNREKYAEQWARTHPSSHPQKRGR